MIRVVLVDDEENSLDLLEILLRQVGDVTVIGRYGNAFDALKTLETEHADAVFMDIELPGMTGMEAARQIKTDFPQTKIVFTTAYSDYAVEAFDINSVDYLLKPFTLPRLKNSIQRLLHAKNLSSVTPTKDSTRIQCMGGFYIHSPRSGNKMVSWKTNKEKELCAFLIHHQGRPLDVPFILESVWPESDLDKARTYLYTCMSYLRKDLKTHDVQISIDKMEKGYKVELRDVAVDSADFEKRLDQILSTDHLDKYQYDSMNELFTGDYMANCDYPWALPRKERLTTKYLETLRKFQRHFKENGFRSLEEDCLKRILAIAPDSESDGRELIRLYLSENKRNEALKTYKQLAQTVHSQLNVDLEEATVKLYERLTMQ